MKPETLLYNLYAFTGTERWHRYSPLFRNVFLTDGALYLAENAGAFWLMDMIVSYIPDIKDRFAIAILTKAESDKALFTLQDDIPAKNVWAMQGISWTDFPLDEIKLYVVSDGENWTILLSSEY